MIDFTLVIKFSHYSGFVTQQTPPAVITLEPLSSGILLQLLAFLITEQVLGK